MHLLPRARLRKGLLTAAACFLVIASVVAQPVIAQPVAMPPAIEYDRYEEALREAKQQGKHLALYFHADAWDAPETLREVLPEDRVVELYLTKDYLRVAVDADTEAGRALAERFNVLDIAPALALVRSDEMFLGYLSLLEAGAEDYVSFFLETDLLHDRGHYAGR